MLALAACGGPNPSEWKALTLVDPLGTAGADRSVFDGVAYAGYYYGGDWSGITVFKVGAGADAAAVKHIVSTEVRALALVGHHLLFSDTEGVAVLDLSNPGDPKVVAKLAVARPNRIVIDKNIAYCTSDIGLQLIDVADPTQPVLAGEVKPPRAFVDVAVADGHAFAAGAGAGLFVYSVANPAEITKVAEVADLQFFKMAYRNKHLYTTGMVQKNTPVIDVSNPAAPTRVAELADIELGSNTVTGAYAVGFFGELLARSTEGTGNGVGAGTYFYDVSDPKNPKAAGSWDGSPSMETPATRTGDIRPGVFNRISSDDSFAYLPGPSGLGIWAKR